MKSNILPLVAGTYYIALRQDLLLLCQSCTYRKDKSRSSAHCKALILSVLENWTNKKLDAGKEADISMTMPQWREALYGMYGETIIRDSLEELIKEGFLERKNFRLPGMSGKDQYKYTLKYQVIIQRMETLTSMGSHSSNTVFLQDEPVEILVQTGKSKGSSDNKSSLQTRKSKDNVVGTQNHYTESTQSSSTDNGSDLSISKPPLEGYPFQDKDEITLWDLLRASGFAKKDHPNDKQVKHVIDLVKSLKTRHFEIEWVTRELLEKSFEWQASVKRFKQMNREVGNAVTCLPDYIDAGLAGWAIPVQEMPESVSQDDFAGDMIGSVIWTRYPSKEVCENPLAYIHLFEEMSLKEAKVYDYDNGTYGYLMPQEEEAIREYLKQERLVAVEA